MGEQRYLKAREAAWFLGMNQSSFHRARSKASVGQKAGIIKSIKYIQSPETKRAVHLFNIKDLEEAKEKIEALEKQKNLYSSKEAAAFLGLALNTFLLARVGARSSYKLKHSGIQDLKPCKIVDSAHYFKYKDLLDIKTRDARPVLICSVCKSEFKKNSEKQVYCSRKCGYKANNSNSALKSKKKLKALSAKPKNNASKLNPQRAVRPTRSLDVFVPKTDYETGVQTTTAQMCACGRGAANPFTKICSTCKIEGNYKMTTKGKRMRGI